MGTLVIAYFNCKKASLVLRFRKFELLGVFKIFLALAKNKVIVFSIDINSAAISLNPLIKP